MLFVVVRGVLRVSCMTVLCLPPLPELASFASKLARAFCSRGTCRTPQKSPLGSGYTVGMQPFGGHWPGIPP